MPEDDQYETVTLADEVEARLLCEVAAEHGVRTERPALRAPDPELVLYVVGALQMVKAALEDFQDRKVGGQIVDLRPGEVLARREPGLEWGRVLVIAADGSFELREDRRDRFAQIRSVVLRALGSRAGATVEQARSAVTEALQALPPAGDGPNFPSG